MMKAIDKVILTGIIVLMTYSTSTVSVSGQDIQPPVAEQKPVTLEMHGDVREDPYFWIRERENPEVINYLEAENEYFEQMMEPLAGLQEELFEEIKGRIKQDDSSVPYTLGAHSYYTRYEPGKQYPIFARQPADSQDGEETILLNVNDLAADHDFYAANYSSSSISPNGRLLAWSADTSGRRFYTLRFRDMETGEDLPDVIPAVTGNLAWASDNKTIFYSKQDPTTLRWSQIYKHRLGTDSTEDVLVYEEKDDTFYTYVWRTRDGRYLMIGSSQTLADEHRFLDASTPDGEFTIVTPRERGHEHSVDHANGYFYIRSNREAPNFKLMRTPVEAASEENWETILPERDDVFLVGFEPFQNFLAVTERSEGLPLIRVIPWNDDSSDHYIEFDDAAYAARLGSNPQFATDLLRFVYESPTTPATTYDYDTQTRTRTLLKQTEVLGDFSSDLYFTERLMIPARDGEVVPTTVVYRKDRFKKDGSNPLLLYGYGSYGSSIQPYFSSARMSLLDRGFVYAIAHIRGSETLGRRWYEDGKLLNKKNTFYDFIDVGKALVADGYADADRLYGMGGSAGGLLVGAVMNMAPDLFDGIVAHVPWVDVVTTMLDDSIPLTTSEYDEWGNPNDPEYYDYMLSYSPYDNVERKDYPNLLVTTGLNDSQVQYWEPAKWVAKLREMKTDDNLLLMHINMGAGHGGSTGRYDRYRETARDYAFLIQLANRSDQTAQ